MFEDKIPETKHIIIRNLNHALVDLKYLQDTLRGNPENEPNIIKITHAMNFIDMANKMLEHV